jgi:hypothetical protein
MTPQQTYDAAVNAANAAHQVATADAAKDFARYHAGLEGYEAARQTLATLTGIADAARTRALAVAARSQRSFLP